MCIVCVIVSLYSFTERTYMEKKQKESFDFQSPKIYQAEDAAPKAMTAFFADELFPQWGIEGKVISLAPTELVHLDIQKLYQDMNFVMEDGSWKHFEFQSKNEGLDGLKRFRTYEALTSYQYKVPVTTYVLFSGKIKKPMTEFTEGLNTYRIHPIIMQKENADELLEELLRKSENGEPITRTDLVQLTLCPLMGGKMEQKDRIKTAYKITQSAATADKEDVRKIEAVLYAMAEKFLESMDMEEIMEDIRMTRLGKMLVEAGYQEGEDNGIIKNKLENAKNLIDILDVRIIAERIGLPLETVEKLKQESTK